MFGTNAVYSEKVLNTVFFNIPPFNYYDSDMVHFAFENN